MFEIIEIHDFVGYGVSRDGRIWSRRNKWGLRQDWVEMRQTTHSKGYSRVCLYLGGAKCYMFVHRIVASVFIGEIPIGMEVNHINGIKTDNRLDNLEICTPSENVTHSRRVLGSCVGSRHGCAKLTKRDVDVIRESTDSSRACAKRFGVSKSAILNIRSGKAWRQAAS